MKGLDFPDVGNPGPRSIAAGIMTFVLLALGLDLIGGHFWSAIAGVVMGLVSVVVFAFVAEWEKEN